MVYLSDGNLRMKIPTFSIMSKHTCPNATTLCKKFCYAKKAERIYKNTYNSRFLNTIKTLSESFTKEAIKEIDKRKSNYIRIHESGDFYSQEYLNKWFEICRAIPDKKFLVYTQMWNLKWRNKPKNMVVYWTVWPDTVNKVKRGLKAFVVDNGKGRIPPYNTRVNGVMCKKGNGNNITCDKCLYCFEGRGNVKFKLH